MKPILELVAFFFIMALAFAIIKAIWFRLRWACGWRPKIFDEKTVEITVNECVQSSASKDFEAAVGLFGRAMTEEEKVSHVEHLQVLYRLVIERYVSNFSFKS
jgi:hypothetical protein